MYLYTELASLTRVWEHETRIPFNPFFGSGALAVRG